MANKINYTGSSKLIQKICEAINDLIDSGGGGGGSTISITPTLSSGTKIADYEIDGDEGSLYAPSGGGGGSTVSVEQIQTSGTRIAVITVDGTATNLYAPSGGGGGGDDPRFNRQIKLYAKDGELHIGGVAE